MSSKAIEENLNVVTKIITIPKQNPSPDRHSSYSENTTLSLEATEAQQAIYSRFYFYLPSSYEEL